MPRADEAELRERDGEWTPAWLGPEDHPWLDALLDEARRFAGRPVGEWRVRALEPLRSPVPPRRQRMAVTTLDALCGHAPLPRDPSPAELRAVAQVEAQRARDGGAFDRGTVMAAVSQAVALAPEAVEERLFADMPGERRLALPEPLPDAHGLALRTNLAVAQGLLRSASRVEIDLASRSRALVRQILLRRLLCTVRPAEGGGVRVEASGPFALFRHTRLYGGAIASVVPTLRGADAFTLRAECEVGGRALRVRLGSGDPVFPPGEAPRRYDSKLEERFARDFARAAPDWDVVREPEPVRVADAWMFPDFALVHRGDPRRRWLVEVVGFWTPAYLDAKLARLRAAGRADLVLCVDETLGCDAAALPAHARILPFRRRVDAEAVARIVAGPAPAVAAAPTARVERLDLRDLFLDYAGRHAPGDPIHTRLLALRPGQAVDLRVRGDWTLVADAAGNAVAALSAAGKARMGACMPRIRAARVAAVVERSAEQTHLAYRGRLRVPRWRVPVVEVEIEA